MFDIVEKTILTVNGREFESRSEAELAARIGAYVAALGLKPRAATRLENALAAWERSKKG